MHRSLATLFLIVTLTGCAVAPQVNKWPYEGCADAEGMVMNIKLFCKEDTSHSCTHVRTTTFPSCIIGESSYEVNDTITCNSKPIDKGTLLFECRTNNTVTVYGVVRRMGFRNFRLITYSADSANKYVARYVMKSNRIIRAELLYRGPNQPYYDSIVSNGTHHVRVRYHYNLLGALDSIVSKDKFVGDEGLKQKTVSVFWSRVPQHLK